MVVATLLPLSLAAAVSTVPVLAMIAVLLSENARASAPAYLVGWAVGLFAVAAVCSLGLAAVIRPTSVITVPGLRAAEVVVGAVLLVAGVLPLVRRGHPVSAVPWTDRLGDIGPASAAGLGVLLNLRPKALLIAGAVGLAVGASQPTVGEGAIAVAIYAVVASSTVTVPIVLTLARPALMGPQLQRAQAWMQRHQAILTGMVMIIVGALIVANGIANLAYP